MTHTNPEIHQSQTSLEQEAVAADEALAALKAAERSRNPDLSLHRFTSMHANADAFGVYAPGIGNLVVDVDRNTGNAVGLEVSAVEGRPRGSFSYTYSANLEHPAHTIEVRRGGNAKSFTGKRAQKIGFAALARTAKKILAAAEIDR